MSGVGCAGAHATYELSPQMGAGLRSKRSGFLSSPESHYRGPASSSRNAADVWRARPAMDVRERYQIAADPTLYYEESEDALNRASRAVARLVVAGVLENF